MGVMMYYVYLLCCADGTLYTGLAKDVQRRLQEHQASPKGARYTRSRRPVELLAVSPPLADRRAAARLEYALKKKTRAQKLSWVQALPSDGSAYFVPDLLARLL
jgi:putative endonuclease